MTDHFAVIRNWLVPASQRDTIRDMDAELAEAKRGAESATECWRESVDRVASAEAERDKAISLLRLVVQADRDDAKMGHPNPGDSCVSVILALRVYEYLAALAEDTPK